MENNSYDFSLFLYFHNIKTYNLYDTLQFKNLVDKPIIIDNPKKEIKIRLNKAKNRGGIYYETAYFLNSKTKKKLAIFLTIYCGIDNIFNFDVNEEKGINIEIIEMWDIDYKESYKEERKIENLKINEKDIQNFEQLFERKRWNLINFNISSLSSKEIFSSKTLSFLMDENNKGKNYLYNVILTEESILSILNEKKEKNSLSFLEDEKKAKIQLLLDKINKEFNEAFNGQFFDEEPNFIGKIFLKPIKNEYDKQFKELKDIFNSYDKYWDMEKFSEKDLYLFVSYSDLTINFSYFKYECNRIFINILDKYKIFKEQILKKDNLSYQEKSRIISGFSRYCYQKINENNPVIPKFYKIDELPNDDPYKIACENFETIIKELKEYSCFFKKAVIFESNSSELINIWDFNEYEIKQLCIARSIHTGFEFKNTDFNKFINLNKELNNKNAKNKDEENEIKKIILPKLSMLTLNQVKEHLLNLIPKFFFKVKYTNFSAVSNRYFFILFIDEPNLLDIKSIDCFKSNKQRYILPIMIEIMHEIFNHLKTKYEDNISDSPLLNPMSLKKVLLCPNEFEPESGFCFEQLLIDSPNHLIALKTPNKDLYKLTDTKFWIQRTVKLFKEITSEYAFKYNITTTKSDNDSCSDRKRATVTKSRPRCVF